MQWSPRRPSSKTGVQALELQAVLVDTGELIDLPGCHRDTRIRELKELLEVTAGIPSDLQRLSYLDEGDLPDEATLRSLDVVPGARVSVRVWRHDGWHQLVAAALRGDAEVLRLGVTDDPSYGGFRTAHAARLGASELPAWRSRRAFVALFVAASRDHAGLVRLLLRHGTGAIAGAATPSGRTALHAAAVGGSLAALDLLLRHGAPTEARDADGLTALQAARRWAPRSAGADRAIFRFVWRRRAEATRPPPPWLEPEELMPHQRFDSVLRTSLDGRRAQRYQACLPPVCAARGPAGQGRGGRGTGRPAEKC